MSEKEFQKRIGYDGDIKLVLEAVCSSYDTSEENMYWLNLGKVGLRYTTKLF